MPADSFMDQPQVVVKFRDQIKVPYRDGMDRELDQLEIGPWSKLESKFPGITLKRLLTAASPDELQALVKRAQALDQDYKGPNLATYFYISAPMDTDLDALAKELSTWRSVSTAYVDRPGPDPVVNASDDPRAGNQGYLNAAPNGIDARYAWGFPGGDGAGERLIDLERGWTLDHEDLVAHNITLLHGTLRDGSRSHGSGVLGEICARDNTVGCVGIVPNLADVDVVSYFGSTRPDAILAAITNMSFGHVLLLEAQVDGANGILAPIEVYDADFDMIRLATALGITVVEAGGNGTNGNAPEQDFDTYTNASGERILFRDPSNPEFRDSGAIIVSATTSTAPYTRMIWAPRGRRVDCFAWGQNINTLASDPSGTTTTYTTSFDGTSGASPIVTGAALAIQGIAQAQLGFRFSPRQLRAILSDPALNTPRASTETAFIGVMPNLKAIIDNQLNVAPDVYLRDFVGDMGEPHTGPISASPDIIVRPTAVTNPQSAFGQGSGTENTDTLGFEAEAGQDNFIYVRARNQGGGAATNVKATVYWSPVATLVTPDLWNLVGSTTIANVPTGEVLTVADAITWPSDAIPAPGHYCFVGLLDTARDPAPNPGDLLDFGNFNRFIRENNNVTWRNFNVVDNDPTVGPNIAEGFKVLEFLAPGAPDKGHEMDLEILARLPRGSKVMLEVPLLFAQTFKLPIGQINEQRRAAIFNVNPFKSTLFRALPFQAKARHAMRLLVSIPEAERASVGQVVARQMFQGREVGRVTWRLMSAEDIKKRQQL